MTDSTSDANSNQRAAELADNTGGAAASGAFGVDAQSIIDVWGDVAAQAIAQPMGALKISGELMRNWAGILLGQGDEFDDVFADRRFADESWHDNPVYRRIARSYGAWVNSLDTWLAQSDLAGIERERARFVLDAAKDVLAPVNMLPGNPAAMRKAGETNGRSVWTGIQNFVDDLQHNHGYPAAADRNAYELGVDVAASEGAVVFRNELLELIQYKPLTEQVSTTPLLYVFSQVNRFYLGDLTPDRSLFQRLLEAGIPVYAVSWRNPSPEHASWNIDSYADGVISAIAAIREISGCEKVHLMGLCAGGLVTTAAAGALRARKEDWVESLSLFVNVLDYRPDDSDFGLFVSDRGVDAQKAMVRQQGVFSEKNVYEMFALLRIEENIMSFMRSNYLMGDAPVQHPLLFWSIDYTRVPAEMQCDFLELSRSNKLAKAEQRILGKRVNLGKIKYPVYIMAGSTDHITPWKACYRSTQLFGEDPTFVLTNQNHTQTISGRLDNKHLKYWVAKDLPEDPEAAMADADEKPGSWVFHWIDWLADVQPEKAPAVTELGSPGYPVIEPAPGSYVREK
ncbi:MAG: alpha/beta fold hydrolase [Pseudomonadaceae bacterium]|nr:alpha/beta fold hydrolase [Pseudomonadaceae bacterium]